MSAVVEWVRSDRATTSTSPRPAVPRATRVAHTALATTFVVFASAACSSDGGAPRPGAGCRGGKCDDGVDAPALEAISLAELGECRAKFDRSTTDPFFQTDGLACSFRAPPVPTLRFHSLYVDLDTADGAFLSTESIDATEADGRLVDITRFHASDAYPLTLAAATIYGGFDGVGTLAFEARARDLTREAFGALETAPFVVGAPFDVWPVALYPDESLAAAWPDAFVITRVQYTLALDTEDISAVGGPTATRSLPVNETWIARGSEPIAKLAEVHYLPVPRGGFDVAPSVSVDVRVDGSSSPLSVPLDGPGYFLVSADGRIRRASPDELPDTLGGAIGGLDGGVVVADGGIEPTADAAVEPTCRDEDCGAGGRCVDGACVSDPCGGTCSDAQACVAGRCVVRADQTQDASCNPPRAACEEAEDCADGHVCAGGKCRRATCQTQDTSCNTARAVCDGEDTDCPEEHVCVAGTCRRLACQVQDTSCNTPRATCENDDADCPADHVCITGKCARLACQAQDTSCNTPRATCENDDDSDCPAEHACVSGKCRRLACQVQDTSCNTPRATCEEPGDCPADHACDAGRCVRATCAR